MSSNRKPGIHIAWTTITYRSVMLMILAGLIVFFAAAHFAFPQYTNSAVNAAGKTAGRLLEMVAGAAGTPSKSGDPGSQQAHITALDGTVRVKKAGNNTWVNADYNIPLEKGDVIQTSSEGMAKIVFGDGTNYTVKQDSLIVIEENSANDQQQTNVTVAVSSGTVDLATGTYVQGSKSQVTVAGATASLSPESAAVVSNNPKTDTHEILVKKGAGEVTRNGETVSLADWEKVNWDESHRMEKSKDIGPPTPISPANMMAVVNAGEPKPVEFSWTPMKNAVAYHLRIAHNPYFTTNVVDRRVEAADVMVSGLGQGNYYWIVQSYDPDGKESVESEKNRFSIVPKVKSVDALKLDLDPFIQHGHVIELVGKTEPGARVMVNGREAPLVAGDGSFRYFTPPLPMGESFITITAQNAQGGVNTLQKRVVIQ